MIITISQCNIHLYFITQPGCATLKNEIQYLSAGTSKSRYCFTLVWTWNATTQYQEKRRFIVLPWWGRTETQLEVRQQGRYLKRMKCNTSHSLSVMIFIMNLF